METGLGLAKDVHNFLICNLLLFYPRDFFKQLRESGAKTPELCHGLKARRAHRLQRILNG